MYMNSCTTHMIAVSTDMLIIVGDLDEGKEHHNGRSVYSIHGISPTVLARDYKGPIKIEVEDER